ncbi:MAG TPA: polysaccharide deacetylase family protein [Candidatus Acidoferrales bacterium]|nr:polysaccharide deacetylase family protein [Candidatus Acidoferrales bacterium]
MPDAAGMNSIYEFAAIGAGAAAAGLASWAAVSPAAQLYGPVLRRTGSPLTLALTFDDGPNPAVTPALAGLLDRYRARATFFLIGRHVRACPQLVAELVARGHALGNHTDTHPNLLWLSAGRIREELARCQDAVARAAGRQPRWMRPPYGFRGPQLAAVVRRGGWAGVALWTRAAFDWKPQPPQPMIRRLARARGGEVLLMHDGDPFVDCADRSHVLRALEHWLPRWTDAGLSFVTLDELAPAAAVAARN